MEFSQVSLTAFISAAILAWVLAAVLMTLRAKNNLLVGFAIAAAMHGLNMAAIALTFSRFNLSSHYVLVMECLHFAFWSLALRSLLIGTTRHKLPPSLTLLFGVCWPVTALVLLAALLGFDAIHQISTWLVLLLSVACLVGVEQVYRYATQNNRPNKLICICLGALFLYDVYLYSHAIIFQEFDPLLWQSRAAVSIGVTLFLSLGMQLLAQQGPLPASIALSRPMAFYTTSLLAVGSLFMVLALGGYYVRIYSGNWGSVVYSIVLMGATLLILTLLVSSRLRARVAVQLNKHLFRHKYDYRSEWLRLINFLAMPTEDANEANQRAFLAAASITKAPGGALWVRRSDQFVPVFQLSINSQLHLANEPANSPFCTTLLKSEWVFFPAAKDNQTLSQHNEQLPLWAENIEGLWLIFPLIAGTELIGFMALSEPQTGSPLTWEDLDLLKTTGRQLASYLKLHQQSEELVENRQFDTYNKLVAFIIHDLNNLIAQQALVVKNAEKHKSNPAFIDDAIVTISNSVERMRNLLKKLKRNSNELVQEVRIFDAVKQAIAECNGSRQILTSDLARGDHCLRADMMRLVMTISHFIKNAQDATPDDGSVHVTLELSDTSATIIISDTGCGMDWDFVHNRLFKPFDTTKSGKGMGIGAYLSREYIKELNGSLEVYSQLKQGTKVTFSIPVHLPQDTGAPARKPATL
ncbi:PEP-CTERM system histidine kinase PrsK [Simiduia sp. 21SJ11W-1]|uniref:XrtA/PEP-CTERM system histidine kinase PrsK n=1 Tax=Simiduia sp. 21SJ11W-1 TaxID=2909669 RepID=UPI00209E1119|nr:XrtA/PEP-CTERM system histidine kinase PrsK [Simiduia sp. 21SJ11W-1]UTA47354.1 PEP-CTERM system histidine kinase PrsK [Simiduia sp. 21SJ11W-1]